MFVNMLCFVVELAEVVAIFDCKANLNASRLVRSFVTHRGNRRNTLLVDECSVDTLRAILDSNDSEVIGVAESRLRT